jgi:hypothetical protein
MTEPWNSEDDDVKRDPANQLEFWRMLKEMRAAVFGMKAVASEERWFLIDESLKPKEEVLRALTVRKGEMIDGVESDVDIICTKVEQRPHAETDLLFAGYKWFDDQSSVESGVIFKLQFTVGETIVMFEIKSYSDICGILGSQTYLIDTSVTVIANGMEKRNHESDDLQKTEVLSVDSLFGNISRYDIYEKEPLDISFPPEMEKAFRACEGVLISKREQLAVILPRSTS